MGEGEKDKRQCKREEGKEGYVGERKGVVVRQTVSEGEMREQTLKELKDEWHSPTTKEHSSIIVLKIITGSISF